MTEGGCGGDRSRGAAAAGSPDARGLADVVRAPRRAQRAELNAPSASTSPTRSRAPTVPSTEGRSPQAETRACSGPRSSGERVARRRRVGLSRPPRTEGTERRSPSGGASLPELRGGAKAGRQPRRRLGTGSIYKHLPTHERPLLRRGRECVGARGYHKRVSNSNG